MSRLSPSVLFMILVVSCLFIFLGPATQLNAQMSVGFILIILLAIGAFLTITSLRGAPDQREASRKMLGTLTGIAAVVCAALLGQMTMRGITGGRLGLVGLMCAPVLLAVVYMGFLAMLSRSGLNVEEGEVLLIQRRMDHQHVIRPPGLHSPMIPALESGVAVMPTYSIETNVDVEMVDTSSLHKVDKISVDTEARIIQHFPEPGELVPVEMRYEGFLKLPYQFPNRDHVFKELADKRGKTVTEARMTADFWIEAIQQQIKNDVEEELRKIIHDYTFYNQEKRVYSKLAPADISVWRNAISAQLKQRIQEKVTQWGIEMLDVQITQVILNADRVKAFYAPNQIEREEKEAERALNREAMRTRKLMELEAEKGPIMAEAEVRKTQMMAEAEKHKAEAEAQRTRYLAEAEAFRAQTLADVELKTQERRGQIENESRMNMIKEMLDEIVSDNPNIKVDDLKHMIMVALDEHEKRSLIRERNLIDQD